MGPENIPHLIRQALMVPAGGKGCLQIRNVRHLRQAGNQQGLIVAQALGSAFRHRPHPRRAGPAFAVHGTLRLADMAHPV